MADVIVQDSKTSTVEDTLVKKSRDANVISGGHLVATALRNEGIDTIFTLCGGHIIDIYDGCLDNDIRIVDVRHDKSQPMLPMDMRDKLVDWVALLLRPGRGLQMP